MVSRRCLDRKKSSHEVGEEALSAVCPLTGLNSRRRSVRVNVVVVGGGVVVVVVVDFLCG